MFELAVPDLYYKRNKQIPIGNKYHRCSKGGVCTSFKVEHFKSC